MITSIHPQRLYDVLYYIPNNMLDLYLILIPIYSLLALLSLLALKSALAQNSLLNRRRQKHSKKESDSNQEQSVTWTHTVKHLLVNFTSIQMIVVRQPSHKISLLLSISIMGLGTLMSPSPFIFAPIGIAVFLTYFLVKMAVSGPSLPIREHYQQILFTCVAVAIDFAMIGMVYKNYHNSVLALSGTAFAINIALDNFVFRPLIALILSLPLSRSQTVQSFILNSEHQLRLIQNGAQKQMLEGPGKNISPSKIPRRIPIPLNLEIEPIPIEAPNQQKVAYSLDILRKIKKEKIGLPPLVKNQDALECSVNSLLNSTSKNDRDHSVIMDHPGQRVEELQGELVKIHPNQQQKNPSQLATITNRLDTIIEGEVDNGQISIEVEPQTPLRSQHPLKITLNDLDKIKNQPLRICLNGQRMVSQQSENNEIDLTIPQRTHKILQFNAEEQDRNTIQGQKNTIGALQIKRQNTPTQQMLEEITFNSPRRGQASKCGIDAESKLTAKKKKKHSHKQNRQIRFSTGEPYLEYLPNMLGKDAKTKKSQALSRKDMPSDVRLPSSVKRVARPKAHDQENLVPTFRIQQL